VLTIHPKGMIINGKKPKNVKIDGNKASWKENSGGGIFREGSIQFSNDGTSLIGSSFNGSGSLTQAFGTTRARTGRSGSSNLSVQNLCLMYPFNDKGDDDVQTIAMNDFYTLVQYFMPEDYLNDFISPDRPQLDGYLKVIAEDDGDNPGENAEYYESLAVPYLTYALSKADKNLHPDVVYLNYIRSDQIMKKTMKDSTVYNRHAGKMYRYHWRQSFSDIDDYITDQESTKYTDEINQMTTAWKDDITSGLEEALLDKEVDDMKNYADEVGQKAIDGECYWAYKAFRELTSTESLNSLNTQMLYSSKGLDDVTRDQERFCSMLSILDPTGYFTSQYTRALQVYQLTSVIPSNFDPSVLGELSAFAQEILEKFRDMYKNSPDPDLSDMVDAIDQAIIDYGWERLLPIFAGAAGISTTMFDFIDNLKSRFGRLSAKWGRRLGNAAGAAAFSFALYFMVNGSVDWDKMDGTNRTEFVLGCVKGAVFYVKAGYTALTTLKKSFWEITNKLFFAEDAVFKNAVEKISAAFGRFLASHGWANRAVQALVQVGEFIGKTFGKVYRYFSRVLKTSLSLSGAQRFSCGFAGLMAVLGIILMSLELSKRTDDTPAKQTAMNAMFLFSSICDLFAAGIGWVLAGATGEAVLIGGYTLSTSAVTSAASIASGLASAAAIIGFIILMVLIFKPEEPPDPVRDFINSDDVKNGGLYMSHKTTIEYFAVQMDDEEESKQIGVTISNGSANGYLYVSDDGTLSLGKVDYSYHTVFTVSTDEDGYSEICTKKIASDDNLDENYYLTMSKSNDAVIMSTLFDPEGDDVDRQRWIVEITGNVELNDKDQLHSAAFTIQNLATKKYIDYKIQSSSFGLYSWCIALEYMKPSGLSMQDITLNNRQRGRSFKPYVGQSGSTSGRSFSISPALPSWLEFDNKIGSISQAGTTTAPVTPATTYTMTVTNSYGSDSDSFVLKVEEADQ
jgi:hypothetical protein